MSLTHAQKAKRPTSREKIETYGGRFCSKCGFERAENEFQDAYDYLKGTKTTPKESQCKYCAAVRAKNYNKSNPEKGKARNRRYFENNREKAGEANLKYIKD